jgi:hypothetical protein
MPQPKGEIMTHHDTATHYRTQDVDGLKVSIATRARSRPAILLLREFHVVAHVPRLDPCSRHFCVIAPDLPGLWFSDAPGLALP